MGHSAGPRGPALANGDAPQFTMLDPVAKLIELVGPRPRVAVAYSGGVDSTVLAHLLVRQRRKFRSLRLLHVDHGLQPASAEWGRHCARQARAWRVPMMLLNASVGRTRGESPEAAARDARYALLASVVEPGEVLVTAQHRDDQVETLLLQLFRGAGVTGLSAMPASAPWGSGLIARPLLGVSRAQIEAAAQHARLHWIEDPSNADTRYSRNFLRQRLMPLIREHWPGVDKALARSATHMAAAAALLNERAAQDLATIADGAGLSVTGLRALSIARRRNALRGFIARHRLEMPDASRLQEMTGPLLDARADAQPEVCWANARLVRTGSRLELHTPRERTSEFAGKSWRWQEDRRLILDHNAGVLELIFDDSGLVDVAKLPSRISVRPRQGGEKLRPGPRARTQSLKKLLQGARMPVDQRAGIPLLFAGEKLIAAGDRWIDASIAATVKSRRRARLRWRPAN
jgi:tRNA(Ile)-lysidine synthase